MSILERFFAAEAICVMPIDGVAPKGASKQEMKVGDVIAAAE